MPKLVLPIVRVVAWVAIAAALVYLAFFKTDPPPKKDAQKPSIEMTSSTVPVTRGTVTNAVALKGTVNAEPPVTVKATSGGKVGDVKVKPGTAVAENDVLFTVKVPIEETASPGADPSGESGSPATSSQPKFKVENVRATAAGTVATVDVLAEQDVQIGTPVATISNGAMNVQTQLTSADQYRLPTIPEGATVTVPSGPAPFQCTGLHVLAPKQDSDNQQQQPSVPDPTGQSGGVTLQCAIPGGTSVYAGSAADVSIDAGTATDVLVVPITAVDGKVGSSTLYVVGEDGEPVPTPVEVGITDGMTIEVRSGVEEGAEVLEFTPTQQLDPADPMEGYGE